MLSGPSVQEAEDWAAAASQQEPLVPVPHGQIPVRLFSACIKNKKHFAGLFQTTAHFQRDKPLVRPPAFCFAGGHEDGCWVLFNGAFDNRYCCSSTGDGHGCQAPRTCCTTAPLNAIPPENETTRRRRTSVYQQIDGLLGKEWGWEMKGGRGGHKSSKWPYRT